MYLHTDARKKITSHRGGLRSSSVRGCTFVELEEHMQSNRPLAVAARVNSNRATVTVFVTV